MAIEVTTFNYPTVPGSNIDEVYEWLLANASEYFPGRIEKIRTGQDCRIVCKIEDGDDVPRICIPFYNSSANYTGYIKARYDTGINECNPNGTVYSSNAYRKAAKTSNGIAIMAHASRAVWFVSKTMSGHVCVWVSGAETYNGSNFRFIYSDLEKSSGTSASSSGFSALVNSVRLDTGLDHTALVPIVFRGGDYTDKLLMTPFTQATFFGDLQTVLIDGQEYVYDGFIALKS